MHKISDLIDFSTACDTIGLYRYSEVIDRKIYSQLETKTLIKEEPDLDIKIDKSHGIKSKSDLEGVTESLSKLDITSIMSDPFFVLGIKPGDSQEKIYDAISEMYSYYEKMRNNDPKKAEMLLKIWKNAYARLKPLLNRAQEGKIWWNVDAKSRPIAEMPKMTSSF
jgi:predicted RNA-binding protein